MKDPKSKKVENHNSRVTDLWSLVSLSDWWPLFFFFQTVATHTGGFHFNLPIISDLNIITKHFIHVIIITRGQNLHLGLKEAIKQF